MQEPIIKVKDLVVKYGARTVLNGIDLEIYKGESIAILGKSGCGKSTLLRHLIGLSQPTSGQIIVKGQDITWMAEDEKTEILKKLGMLFQSSALFNSMRSGSCGVRETESPEISALRYTSISAGYHSGLAGLTGVLVGPGLLT